MAGVVWNVLYTKHKSQKRKVWHEGVVRFQEKSRKVSLYDEISGHVLDELFLGPSFCLESGVIIELPNYLVDPDQASQDGPSSLAPSATSDAGAWKVSKVCSRPNLLPVKRLHTNIAIRESTGHLKRSCSIYTGSSNFRFFGVVECLELLNFSSELSSRKSSLLCPKMAIPDVFSNIRDYTRIFVDCIFAEINTALYDTAMEFARLYWGVTNVQGAPFPTIPKVFEQWPRCGRHGSLCKLEQLDAGCKGPIYRCQIKNCVFRVNKEQALSINSQNANFLISPSAHHQRQKYYHSNHVLYFPFCELMCIPGKADQPGKGSKTRLFLRLLKVTDPSSSFSMHDCWIISNSPSFQAEVDCTEPFWLLAATSMYHGPSKSGTIEVQCLPSLSISQIITRRRVHKDLFAMRSENLRSEVSMLTQLVTLRECQHLPSLVLSVLDPMRTPANFAESSENYHGEGSPTNPFSAIETIRDDIAKKYALNYDQAFVLGKVSQWFNGSPDSPQKSPFILVHGVFGSGKSHLLAAVIIFLSHVFEEINDHSSRILVASLTNVAVDNILLSLQASGFTDFARVGSVKNIAKPILPHVVHWCEEADAQLEAAAAMTAYREMLNDDTLSYADKKHVQEAIVSLSDQRNERRAERLKSIRVVGVTCASTELSIFSDNQFTFALLDECSQMTECMSILPLTKFRSSRAILMGDPLQLPPVTRTPASSSADNESHGLSKTLFMRLCNAGQETIFLRKQYRCHPDISNLCNRLFYSQKILNGCTKEDRAAILPGLPALFFLDMPVESTRQMKTLNGSLYNPDEVRVICNLLTVMLAGDLPGEVTIGVIALYKAQEDRLRQALAPIVASIDIKIEISTVDAFQGSEKDIIIVSTVRSEGIGFTNCPRRLNVTLSRAKLHMIIVGSSNALRLDPLWADILRYCGALARETSAMDLPGLPHIFRESFGDQSSDFVKREIEISHTRPVMKTDYTALPILKDEVYQGSRIIEDDWSWAMTTDEIRDDPRPSKATLNSISEPDDIFV
uniref:AAA+ ATPase domain-containing protein n=1 Tax=Spongospora subterranea TaxID=70186 RepID=A0A0H5RN44_9EUKA|eukprot:CRZ10164.1 hypothetical protein [Spongospora subterranea]